MFRSNVDDIDSREAEEAVGQIGAQLHSLRTQRGERLEDVADYLGIKSIYLYSIEQGDLSVIPSKRNVRSFTSSYANYLGLDGDAIMDQLIPVIQSLEGAKAPSSPWSFIGLDRTSAVVLASSVLLGILAGWSYLGDAARLDLIAPPVTAGAVDQGEPEGKDETLLEAERALAGLESEANQIQAKPAQQPTAGNTDNLETADDRGIENQAAAVDTPRTGAEDDLKEALPANVLAAAVAARGDGAQIYEAENTDARVIVRALDTSWIQVSSRDRSYMWTRTMQPREMLLVPNRPDLELWAGDASGIEVLLDGAILPPLGPPGTVVRGVSLAPDALEATSDTVNQASGSKPTF